MIWARAEGPRVWDTEGREYLDLSAGFGVAALGHRNPRVMQAVAAQPVAHALGDLIEAEVAVELRRRPARAGGDRVRAFPRAARGWLPGPVHRRAYGEDPGRLPADAGCVIAEPVQGRTGARVPPDGWLEQLRARCDETDALLIADAIDAGLGRTGVMWPGEEVADVIRRRQGLGHGLPISGLFVRRELAGAWELGPEDVLMHTHVLNPLACAAAHVVLDEVPSLLGRVAEAGERFAEAGWDGRGLLRSRPGDWEEAWRRGVPVVPAGEDGSLISATPSLVITDADLDEALATLDGV